MGCWNNFWGDVLTVVHPVSLWMRTETESVTTMRPEITVAGDMAAVRADAMDAAGIAGSVQF